MNGDIKTDTLLGIDEVAAVSHLDPSVIRDSIRADSPIPYLKVGRRIFFCRRDVENFLLSKAKAHPDLLPLWRELAVVTKTFLADPSDLSTWRIKIQCRLLWRAACRRLQTFLIRKKNGQPKEKVKYDHY